MRLLFLIIGLCCSGFVYADTAVTDLHQLLSQLHTVQADFQQDTVDQTGKVLQQSAGQMLLQRPGKFRWQITKPNKQLIVTNGERLWIYDPDLEQVTIRRMQKERGEAPALLLSDDQDVLETKFSVKEVTAKASTVSGERWFLLTPKDKSSLFATIQLGFNKSQIQAMKMQDHLGHTTLIRFSHVKNDVAPDSKLFSFVPPKHIDVIDETHR